MKAYKILDYDFSCQGFQYEVGKTYKIEGELTLCVNGFHACERAIDCMKYYPPLQSQRYAEVELSGEIITGENKSVAECITIIKELTFDEYLNECNSDGVDDSTGVNSSEGVNDSTGVNSSEGVNDSTGVNSSEGVNSSNGVNESKGINRSTGVNSSEGVNDSTGVNSSEGINYSTGVNSSEGVNSSNGVNESKGVNYSYGVANSYGVNSSEGINYSTGVNSSEGINYSTGVNDSVGVNRSEGVNSSNGVVNSYGVANCNAISDCLFMSAVDCRRYQIFNQQSNNIRIKEVRINLNKLLGGWHPRFNNIYELNQKFGSYEKIPRQLIKNNTIAEAWETMPPKAIEYIKSLPEYDSEIFNQITGME